MTWFPLALALLLILCGAALTSAINRLDDDLNEANEEILTRLERAEKALRGDRNPPEGRRTEPRGTPGPYGKE